MSGSARVAELRRFPVKSLLGELRDHLDVDLRGCAGDRLWSVRTADGKIGSGKNTRRFAAVPGLLDLRAELDGERVVVTFPDGTRLPVDAPETAATISRYVGQPVGAARESDVSHFDYGPLSLAGTASIDAVARERGEPVDPARFRANVLLETAEPFAEDGWVGRRLRLGTAVLRVTRTATRCVMVDMPTADLPAQPGNLAAAGRVNDGCVGVIAVVEVPGRIALGDRLRVE